MTNNLTDEEPTETLPTKNLTETKCFTTLAPGHPIGTPAANEPG